MERDQSSALPWLRARQLRERVRGSALARRSRGGRGALAHAHRQSGRPGPRSRRSDRVLHRDARLLARHRHPLRRREALVDVAQPRGGATIALTEPADVFEPGRMTGIVLRSADARADYATLEAAQVDVGELIGGDGTIPLLFFFETRATTNSWSSRASRRWRERRAAHRRHPQQPARRTLGLERAAH